jgi:hypothetical protein
MMLDRFCLQILSDIRSTLYFDFLPSTFSSSTLLELNIKVKTFTDCLYLLDGRFNRLHTFYVDVVNIYPQDEEVEKQVSFTRKISI